VQAEQANIRAFIEGMDKQAQAIESARVEVEKSAGALALKVSTELAGFASKRDAIAAFIAGLDTVKP